MLNFQRTTCHHRPSPYFVSPRIDEIKTFFYKRWCQQKSPFVFYFCFPFMLHICNYFIPLVLQKLGSFSFPCGYYHKEKNKYSKFDILDSIFFFLYLCFNFLTIVRILLALQNTYFLDFLLYFLKPFLYKKK